MITAPNLVIRNSYLYNVCTFLIPMQHGGPNVLETIILNNASLYQAIHQKLGGGRNVIRVTPKTFYFPYKLNPHFLGKLSFTKAVGSNTFSPQFFLVSTGVSVTSGSVHYFIQCWRKGENKSFDCQGVFPLFYFASYSASTLRWFRAKLRSFIFSGFREI